MNVLGAVRKCEEAPMDGSPSREGIDNRFEQAAADTFFPEVRPDGERAEEAEAAPPCHKIRAGEFPARFRRECRFGLCPPPRADIVRIPGELQRIGKPQKRPESQTENSICRRKLRFAELP